MTMGELLKTQKLPYNMALNNSQMYIKSPFKKSESQEDFLINKSSRKRSHQLDSIKIRKSSYCSDVDDTMEKDVKFVLFNMLKQTQQG